MDHDVIIIGGGPSGLSTALHLQRIAPHPAPRILILEKARYPRPKLCAGGLVFDAEIILQRLGLDVSEVPHVDVESIHFDFEAKGLNIRIPKRHALRVIRRDEFDNWLAKKAESRGIEIREGVTVKNILPQKDGAIVETDQGIFHSQIVVGADGSNGITRRCILPNAPVYTARVLEVLTPTPPTTLRAPPPNSENLGEGGKGLSSISSPSPKTSPGTCGTSPRRSKANRCGAGESTIRTSSRMKSVRN